MSNRRIYIQTAAQISIQKPLTEEWLDSPVVYNEPYTRSIDPNFKEYLDPMQSRRMGKVLKRALVTATKSMVDAGIDKPDAVITGTGLGCIENTEHFLDQLCRDGEEMLKPTYFMQSTHNTIGSLISIHIKCNGYNTTYSHKSVSFDSALLDAITQIRLGDINNALVCGNDEMTPSYFDILKRTGYVGRKGETVCGEASVAMMISDVDTKTNLCEIAGMKMLYTEEKELLHQSIDNLLVEAGINVPDAMMCGVNGTSDNDAVYETVMDWYRDSAVLHYKHIFGECYAASSLGVYVSANCLNRGFVPKFMRYDMGGETEIRNLLVVNHSDMRNISLILLKRCL